MLQVVANPSSQRILWVSCIVSLIVSIGSALLTEHVLSERISILGEFLGLELSFNKGVAFGFDIPGILQPLLIGSALILVSIIAVKGARTMLSQLGFGLVIGGGFANVFDRIPDGLVTDMIQIGSFPVFNIADSCITIGAGLLLLEMILQRNASKSAN